MIKAIILDVDGVIVGDKIGYNSPHPHPEVLQALKTVREKGVLIALCTAKPHYAISEIIEGAALHNPHIADAGAVIIDPIDSVIVEKHIIKKFLAQEVLEVCMQAKVYIEFYTVDDYFIQESEASDITTKHTHILQREPKDLQNIITESTEYEITKIMPIALNEDDKKRVSKVLAQFEEKLSISWGVHPIALPLQFGIVTAKGSSKKEGAEAIVKSLDISMSEVLGIGDSTSDWKFISLCGYGATVANGSKELKDLLKSKGEGKYYIADNSVDENGILQIFKNFFSEY